MLMPTKDPRTQNQFVDAFLDIRSQICRVLEVTGHAESLFNQCLHHVCGWQVNRMAGKLLRLSKGSSYTKRTSSEY
jgi:hypothetical protein